MVPDNQCNHTRMSGRIITVGIMFNFAPILTIIKKVLTNKQIVLSVHRHIYFTQKLNSLKRNQLIRHNLVYLQKHLSRIYKLRFRDYFQVFMVDFKAISHLSYWTLKHYTTHLKSHMQRLFLKQLQLFMVVDLNKGYIKN